ncbi:FAD-binding and (Fe-S)-binding domain-containing protein [Rhodococcus sp. IEGM 1381]|uniref:FAD-binding and (Fe-S)-binding domain-containing protein n=1 Tax=Rhodococcus sp. IEGM 1381 TaxID=3047085 RepID=UPI0024B746F6|nr:FAD-binding and (Fe-S)-binding domain-containing protein [Rhodococcus sp. IEGM 1381]MDI9895573.1 FAD-binding and (Fe-S)-binding domain-containing protein [Rhodococcus sp. IEGM 1381]
MTSAPIRSDVPALVHRVRETGIDIDDSSRRLAEYSYDASNYRIPPAAVVFPRSADEVSTVVSLCTAAGVAVIGRGGGTSMAGNAIGRGIVLDFSRHMNRVISVDTDSRTAVVEPGIVISELQRELVARTSGAFTFAPDPSSKTRATVGGAVGNDACGNHSVRYGRTSDHTVAMDVVTAEGHLLRVTRSGVSAVHAEDAAAGIAAERISHELRALAADNLALFRVELGRIPRQVSGFHLSHLLPENGFDVARALVGSEGTCAVIVSVTVTVVPVPPAALLLCLGYEDVVAAAADVMAILEFSPAAVEGIDDNIARTMEYRRGPDSVRGLPAGNAWLYVDLDGADAAEVEDKAARLLEELGRLGRLKEGRIVTDPADRTALWRVREDGAGLATRLASGVESWGGWEDAAVAPENLSAYLTDLNSLLAEHELTGVMYGHFGAGCMHVRITFDQRTDAGRRVMYDFLRAAARVVVKHGGSLSGEHGDGRARSELLPVMYSPRMLDAFSRFKRVWDPSGMLNPGSITEPEPMMDNLMLQGIPQREWKTTFDLHQIGTREDLDPFVHATQSCVGVGKCRTTSGGVMCPSFRATGDEKDSTRGRARVLQEMVRSSPTVADGWASKDVAESLDLCLSCKACSSDCPVGVDMATYKSEFLDHHYAGRLRPLSHYSLGWLPRWLKVTQRTAPLLNRVLTPRVAAIAARLGGLTGERALPRFASTKELTSAVRIGGGKESDVVLVVDTFTQGFRPEVAGAAQRVLEDSGRSTECRTDVCCGLTWISTGQLKAARKHLTKAVAALDDGTDRPIVVTEPSCAAAFRKDMPELVPTAAARRVAARVQSFAGAVIDQAAAGWVPSVEVPASVTVQTHCHEYAVFGNATQRTALASVGIETVTEATGCCGVAGNFGFEKSHYELSMKVAEQALAPAVRATEPDTPILTDGFSCHMQVRQLTGDLTSDASVHLAQILDPRSPKGPRQ